MTKLTFFFAFILLSACSLGSKEPTVIDGSSAAAFEQTLSDAKGELGPRDRIKFEAALAEFRAQMFAKAGTRQEYKRLVRRGMNGLTAALIVSKFNSNVDKAGRNAADAVFDVKRAVTGRRTGVDRPDPAIESEKSEERSSEEQRR